MKATSPLRRQGEEKSSPIVVEAENLSTAVDARDTDRCAETKVRARPSFTILIPRFSAIMQFMRCVSPWIDVRELVYRPISFPYHGKTIK